MKKPLIKVESLFSCDEYESDKAMHDFYEIMKIIVSNN